MNTQLNSISAKLKSWRLAAGLQNPKLLVSDIYTSIFRADFYREIWDEPILLAIQDLIAQHPPDRDLFGSQLDFIQERTTQVVAINNLFAGVLFRSVNELPSALTQITEQLQIASEMTLLHTNGSLNRVKNSGSQPSEKLTLFVEEMARQAPSISMPLQRCFDACCSRQELGSVNALLVTQDHSIGMVLPVHTLLEPGSGHVRSAVPSQNTFQSAVERARAALQSRGFLAAVQDVTFSADLTDATYSGSSITVAAAMSMFSKAREWKFDPYTAFTGDINISNGQWRILRVDGIPLKLAAAKRSGIRRVVLPRQNENDVSHSTDLELIFVDDLGQVLSHLVLPQHSLPADSVQQRKMLLLNTYCLIKGWQLSAAKEIQNGVQFTVTPPTSEELTINIYETGAHHPKQSAKHEFQELLRQFDTLDSVDTPLQNVQQVFNIKEPTLRQQIKERFETIPSAQARREQYCDYSFLYTDGKEKLIVKQFSSGKLQLQGYAGPLYRKALDIIISQYNLHFPNATVNLADYLTPGTSNTNPTKATVNSNVAPDVSVALPHIGTDESGKGDYFGPLVIAGVWVDESLQKSLAELGVRDSKELSDRRCQELASAIRDMCPGKYQVVVEISPEKYNQLHEQLLREKRNLNHLLAWGHARAIESLLTRQECKQAIADQFGDEKYIISKLMEKGRAINLLQTPKAERFIAVAAASILARDHFLTRLGQLSKEAGFNLLKGASPEVINTARQIVQKHGADALRRFAKLHFRTTASVLAN